MIKSFSRFIRSLRFMTSLSLTGTRGSIVDAIHSNECIAFVKETCPFCTKMKDALKSLGITFSVVPLDGHGNPAQVQENLYQLTGQRTVPSLFFNGTHVGGFSDLDALIKSGKLDLFVSNTEALKLYKNDLSGLSFEYDLAVIGGGSGGIACAKRAASLGAKVAIFDFVKPTPLGATWGLGGTCVNVGCVPKKLFHHAAMLGHSINYSSNYGWNTQEKTHNWEAMVSSVQGHIKSLNFGYRASLRKAGAKYFNAFATLKDPHTIKAVEKNGKETECRAKYVVIATGERPVYPGVDGDRECCITSDDLFSLRYPPGKTLIIGASYIALECAGALKGLGYDVDVMVRSIFLRGFDQEMANKVADYMAREGVNFIRNSVPKRFEKLQEPNLEKCEPGKIRVTYSYNGVEEVKEYNTVMLAIGREACTKGIGLEELGVALDGRNHVVGLNGTEMTEVPNIFAIGDILTGKPQLTPMAIKSGTRLAERLFSKEHFDKCDYTNVATTVFTPLEYGCIGYSEEAAIAEFGDDDVEVYHSFIHFLESTVVENANPEDYFAKMITRPSKGGKIVGFHVISPHAGEITQGFALGMKMGATVKDVQNTVGIHPTCAEVFTTMVVTKKSGNKLEASGC